MACSNLQPRREHRAASEDWRRRPAPSGDGSRSAIVSLQISHGVKDIVAVGPKPFDMGELGKPPVRTPARQNSDELDGLGDHRAWNRDDGFLDQLLHPPERAECRTRMDGAD